MTDTIRKYALDKIQQKDFNCAKEYTLSMFSGKYKIVILYQLHYDGKMRFGEIKKSLGNNVNTLEWFLDSPARGRSYPESLIKKNKRGPGNHRPDLVCFL
ncbi:winged helix-turn-helix transcriptional regulator [Weissella soli]|uniref:winged helix-turn-helix transcriptional regulator n=1 Tax=Weissella soli TaxID=155866 RepID=UPI003C780BE2